MKRKIDRQEILDELRNDFSEEELSLSLEVEVIALNIAKIYWYDKELTSTAALLHDCGKARRKVENSELFHDMGIIPDEFTSLPGCEHALLSEKIAQKEVNIENRDILNAIRYHVYGRENMSDLEKIIFISCFIAEGTRKEASKVRELVEQDFDEAFEVAFNLKQNIYADKILEIQSNDKKENEQLQLTDIPVDTDKKISPLQAAVKVIIVVAISIIAIIGIWLFINYLQIGRANSKSSLNRIIGLNKQSNVIMLLASNGKASEFKLFIESKGYNKGILVDLPNDLVVNVPGYGTDRLAILAARVAPSLLSLSVSNTLGIKVQYYIKGQVGTNPLTDVSLISKLLESSKETNLDSIKRNRIGDELLSSKYKIISLDLPVEKIAAGSQSFSQANDTEANKFFGKVELTKSIVYKNRMSVAILNGTGKAGIGNKLSVILMENGFKVIHLGNAKTSSGLDDFSRLTTELITEDINGKKDAAKIVKLIGKGSILKDKNGSSLADITIIVGKDLL